MNPEAPVNPTACFSTFSPALAYLLSSVLSDVWERRASAARMIAPDNTAD